MSHNGTGEAAAQGGGLDQLIVFLVNMPPEVIGLLGVLVGIAGALYYYINYYDKPQKLDKTGIDERIQKTIILPTLKHGSATLDWVRIKSTDNTERLVGLSVRSMSSTDKVIVEPDLDDKDKQEEEEYETVQHAVLPGGNRIKCLIRWPIWRVSLLFPWKKTGMFSEYYDLPKQKFTTTDRGIILDSSYNPVKRGGLWRDHSMAGQDKIIQRTFSDAHFDWAESMEQLPEIYSQLNSRVAGQLNIMDRKSENIKEGMKLKNKGRFENAMDD